MKRFWITIILFFVPVLIGLSILEIGMRSVPNDYKYKKDWLDKNASRMHIWILGSSHEVYGISPKYFSKCAFNSAHVSQSLKYDAFIFNKYIDHTDSLEWVVLPISYFSLLSNIEGGIEDWRVKNYCIYYDCPYHMFNPLYCSEIFGNPLPIVRQYQRVRSYWCEGKDDVNCDSLGFDLSYAKENREEWYMNGEKRAQMHTADISEHQQTIRNNIRYAEDIIATCAAKNVDVLLLTTPTCYTYYNNVDSLQYNLMLQTCEKLDSSYTNVHYLNLFQDSRFVLEDFFDGDHLVIEGAVKLTHILDDYISNKQYDH